MGMETLEAAERLLDQAKENVHLVLRYVEQLQYNYDYNQGDDDTLVGNMFPFMELEDMDATRENGDWWSIFNQRTLNDKQKALVAGIWREVYNSVGMMAKPEHEWHTLNRDPYDKTLVQHLWAQKRDGVIKPSRVRRYEIAPGVFQCVWE
jgi:hypothetical protein